MVREGKKELHGYGTSLEEEALEALERMSLLARED
jgi:hypothetical protein